MRLPTFAVVIDGQELSAAQAGISIALVDIGLGAAHDRAQLALSWHSPHANISPGTPVEVLVGFNEPSAVLTGSVDHVSHRPWGLVVDVFAAPSALSMTRVGRSYIELSAGDIVRDLLQEAEVEAGDVDAGPTLAAFHVDERRSAWQYINDLAATTGGELSTSPSGALHMRTAPGAEAGLGALAGAAASALGLGSARRYGAEVHDFAFGPAARLAPETTVLAYGAGSELGGERWHVLVREPAGGAPSGPTLVPGALRDRQAAEQLGGAIEAAAERSQLLGWIRLTGDPGLRAGDPIEVTDFPHLADVSARVRRLRHQVSSHHGFTTTVDLEAAA
ncbi:MAG: hypothetical protein AAGA37_09255 [Actinomycetota bacterium]